MKKNYNLNNIPESESDRKDEEKDGKTLNGTTFVAGEKAIDQQVEEEKPDDVKPLNFFSLYRYSSGKDRLLICIGLLAATACGLCTPANTLIFGRLINAMLGKAGNATDALQPEAMETDPMEQMTQWFLDEIQFFAIFNTIIGVVMLVGSYVSTTAFNYAAHNQIFTIRGRFVKSVLSQEIGWYDLNKSGEFASRINEDLTKLEEGLGEKVVMFAMFMVACVASIIVAFVYGWLLALVCLASLPVTMISVGIVGVLTSRLSKKEVESYAKAGGIAEEVFGAIRTVVAFGGQELEAERYQSRLHNARSINIKKNFFMGLGFGLLWFFIYASYALAFWYGVGLILQYNHLPPDEQVYDAGVMFIVFFSVMMAGMNLGMSSPYIESFTLAMGTGAKVYSIIDRESLINAWASIGERPNKVEGNLSFQDVHFNYPNRKTVKVLKGINISIKRGETVALVGPSGCGKSTTIQLIQRFYDPLEGSVRLDGRDIKDLDVAWLRSQIGVVGQEPVLFGTTIYENIRYGLESATKEQIEAAAKAANAHNFIKSLPEGYHTLVGERGAQMSGGQKQRIAIARALVRNPDILLLDEATSALDTQSEAKVQAALENASKGRTTIIVAHRLSTIRHADRIYVFKDGQIVETGTHRELMDKNGEYFALVTAQTGDAERDGKLVKKNIAMDSVDDDEEIIDMQTDDSDLDDLAHSISMWKVMRWNRREWPYILVGSISSVIMGAAMPLFALIFGEVVGALASDDNDQVRADANRFSLYFVIVGIVVGLATFLQIYTYGVAGEYLTERVRDWSFRSMLRQEIAWFDNKSNGVGALCSKLSSDATAVQGATGQRIGTVLSSVSTLLIAIGIAMFYEWRLGLVALAFAPLLVIGSYLEMKFMEQENMGNAKALQKSTKLAVEVVSNIRTVVSLGRESMFHKKYVELLEPAARQSKRNTHIRGTVYGLSRSVMFFAFAACMYYGGQLMVQGITDLTSVFVVTQALIMGTMSIAGAFAYAPNFQKGIIAAGKVDALMNRVPLIRDNHEVTKKEWKAYGNITFFETEFFYPSRPSSQVLKGLNLGGLQGQTVALVGPSGCGKSTCIQLLERFYDTTAGYVAIDETRVTDVSQKNLRAQLGIVSQEPSLFDRTIAENIAYGDNTRQVSQNDIIEAAKQANIHNFISSLPLGYETRLGDKGTQLSGGQKQRVAIARALIRNPRILLLDEATSALDMESEKIVQEALDKAREGRTCVTIAHRLTTIIDADVIFVINAGKVVEQGTHKELLAKEGMYYDLYTLQAAPN
ncbi:ATP-dependent translocase ABCB1 isoform X1 [Phlebotomus argentipes]|uniref:ATP-dependent translocase ABCB1 isoform X1 n=1 Tax=Phlebotomus argentipes TaxID=94469 RepID=UPI0028930572|nr:ATP-dependent translocase ABCB1 isoform X1 [Phlebotomus argentipes]